MASVPGAPTKLTVTGLDGAIELTWEPPQGSACVNGYTIRTSTPLSKSAVFLNATSDGRRATIKNAPNGVPHTITVQVRIVCRVRLDGRSRSSSLEPWHF